MSFIPFFAFAEDKGYVTLVQCDGVKGFYGATWSETVDVPSNRNYLVTDNKTYKPSYVKDGYDWIPSRSFTFGEVNGGKGNFFIYYSSGFSNEGVIFANGECYPNQTNPSIYGKIAIASPTTAPFVFRGSGKAERGIAFAGAVSCPENCGILAYSHMIGGFYLAFSGDVSKYYGSVVVTSEYDNVGRPWGANLIFKGDASCFGGSVTVGADATLDMRIAASIDKVTLREGARINVDVASGGKLAVRSTFSKEGVHPVPVTIMNASVKAEETRCDLLSMPGDSTCTIKDFKVINDEDMYTMIKSVGIDVSEDGKTKTLYAVYYATVDFKNNEEKLFEHDDPCGFSSVTNESSWSDSNVVHGDVVYRIVKNGGRTTYFSLLHQEDVPYVFPSPGLYFSADTVLFLRSKDNVVSNVFFVGSGEKGVLGLRNNKNDLALHSDRFVVGGRLTIGVRNEIKLRLIGPVEGDENSTITLQSLSGATALCRGWGEMRGDNSHFAGKIRVTSNYPQTVSYNNFASLIVTSASNLGGPRSSFTYDALSLDRYGQLDVRESIVLDEPTRGIFVSWIGRMLVAEEKELAIKQQLTVNGRFYKEGAGTLALGGDLRFLEIETNFVEKVANDGAIQIVTNVISTVVEDIPEDPASRTFYVVGGKVKPLSAHALDGLDVVFSNKTSKLEVGFALDLHTTDEELRTKGICNVKSPSPLAFLDDNPSKKIPVYVECADETPANEYSFGVMTVDSGCAAVLDLLEVIRPSVLSSYKVKLNRVPDVNAGTVTLVANLKKYGFAISIR